jgi:hypothetical protein
MQISELKVKLEINISQLNIFELREIIVLFKDEGGQKSDAEKLLNDILNENLDKDSAIYDKTLELLDFVTGWSQPKYRIWG